MAGHSKWANIQHRKGAQDKKRGKLFTKLIREITIAARIGGGDISANPLYNGDFKAALNAIKAKTIVIVCDNDLYFRPEDNQIEIEHIRNGELRVYQSPWGHCVASPGNDPEFERYLDRAISELLN